MLQMKYRVYMRLLNFLKHVHSHADSNLSRLVLEEQLLNDWPGLSQVGKKVVAELGISGLFESQVSKRTFKREVKDACQRNNEESLQNDLKSYKKMQALRDEVVKGNKYFFEESLNKVRILFRFRVDLFEAKLNFKNKPEYKAEKYLCDSCETEIDENTHVLHCHSYKSLREGKNLNSDSDLSEYLRQVLSIRSELRLRR